MICNIYRSLSGNPNNFLEKLEEFLQKLSRHRNKNIALLGDINIDLLDYGKEDLVNKYVDLLAEHSFAPVISRPTRITNHSMTIIDHIFVNNCHAVTKSGVITESMSDHLATFVTFLVDQNKVSYKLQDDPLEVTSRTINDENIASFESEISATDWNFVHEFETVDEKFDAFESKYSEIYNKNFPIKKNSTKKGRRKTVQPWLLEWLQLACERKNKLYHEFVKNPSTENEETYKKMKKFVTKHIRKAKNKYYNAYFKKHSSDSKKQWQMVNSLLNRKTKTRIKINKIKYNGSEISDSQKIADSFNDYFCNIAERLKTENDLVLTGIHAVPTELPRSRCDHDMELEDSSPSEVIEIIKGLKNKCTSDMSIRPLKEVGNVIAPVLSYLISISLKNGIFPQKLMKASGQV